MGEMLFPEWNRVQSSGVAYTVRRSHRSDTVFMRRGEEST